MTAQRVRRSNDLVAILDMPVFRMMQWKLHLDEPVQRRRPCLISGRRRACRCGATCPRPKRRFAAADLDLHDMVFRGVGIEAALKSLACEGTRARRARRSCASPARIRAWPGAEPPNRCASRPAAPRRAADQDPALARAGAVLPERLDHVREPLGTHRA